MLYCCLHWLTFAGRRVAEVGNAFTSAWIASHCLGELPKYAQLWHIAGIRQKLANFAGVVLLEYEVDIASCATESLEIAGVDA